MPNDWIHDVTVQQSEALETACEMALQSGRYGVSVWRWIEETTAKFEARLDPDVPFGRIHEHPFGAQPPES